ncbi:MULTISPECIES: LysR family transcriptional regulator [Burkholderia]|uniref:LysR family transcriptional regulator n=1 Tax=Burkholderia TaxID=32008 RepID=UPI001199BFA0|nr:MULTISPECIES: LysR family transcriptional regulator [Burkholderia]MDN7739069.1 LysR family transcriptional regulator [Burkholderia gladioli]TWC72293.1 LysR substrate binding domain-containing protein [Burkholderia sp. SJZ089]TWD02325.1 LysR substrate binding domain-containing protein [Burkholderia sp. SJZ115]TWD06971.1 LysR substrate binding domain-containing protein [Burkholderia sp. SJZ091]
MLPSPRSFQGAGNESARSAARVSPQVITRVIGQLEAELGEPLFHRSTRGVRLSAFGASLAEQAAEAIAGIDRIFETREAGEPEAIEGVVRIAAPGVLGRRWVVRALAPLLAAHAGLAIDVRLSEVVADVVDEQIDVGVRIVYDALCEALDACEGPVPLPVG